MDDLDEEVNNKSHSKYFPEIGENFDEEVHYKPDVHYKTAHV
jgi:hypothetical protein